MGGGGWRGVGKSVGARLGGEGVADKEERGGRCTLTKKISRMDLTPSVVTFALFCLVTCTGTARATREAPGTKTKRTNLESAGKRSVQRSTGMFEYKS